MARGCDSAGAEALAKSGVTVTSLKQMDRSQLLNLGVTTAVADILLSEKRPPIQPAIVSQLLFKSKMICCVCRESNKSVIIHHLNGWAKTRKHDEKDLVVICLQHHDEAHSQKALSQNLTPAVLRDLKQKWEQRVVEQDAQAIVGISNASYAHWDYFNHNRLLKIASAMHIAPSSLEGFYECRAAGVVTNDGLMVELDESGVTNKDKYYLYEGEYLLIRYHYMTSLIEEIIKRSIIVDITNHWKKEELVTLAPEGALIFCQGAFNFKRLSKGPKGPQQLRRGYRRAEGIDLQFVFDAWECTSSSSKSDRLSGRTVANIFGLVQTVEDKSKGLSIHISCLATGTGFTNVREPRLGRYQSFGYADASFAEMSPDLEDFETD